MNKYIDQNTINSIINANKIETVISEFLPLQKYGRNFRAICPFHNDTNPSLSINVEKQIYKCFVCNNVGNVAKFLTEYKKISFIEAIKWLAEKINYNFDFTDYLNQANSKYNEEELKILDILEKANSYFLLESQLLPTNHKVKEYFDNRKLDIETRKMFDIGYVPEIGFSNTFLKQNETNLLIKAGLLNSDNLLPFFKNRITFAIKNENNQVVGFSARTLEKEQKPKYINSPESIFFKKNSIIYNYGIAKPYIEQTKQVVITEGFFDVIALFKANIKNSVCLMGTALTKNHLYLLKNKEIILFLDGDIPGIQASMKSFLILRENHFKVKIVNNDTRLDPDEIFNQKGPNVLKSLIDNSLIGIDFIYNKLLEKNNLRIKKDLQNIKNFANEFKNYLMFEDKNDIDFYISKFIQEFNYKIDIENILFEESTYTPEEKQENNNTYISKSYPLKNYQNEYDNTNWIKGLLLMLVNYPELILDYKKIIEDGKQKFNLEMENELYNYSYKIIKTNPETKEFNDLKEKLNEKFNDIIQNTIFKNKINDIKEKKITIKKCFQDIFEKANKQVQNLFNDWYKDKTNTQVIDDLDEELKLKFFKREREIVKERCDDNARKKQ
ncbi:DNA primase [Mycoplasmopsis lipophila]|uniref:DNA primase n=1 Tax=Mycoplasmopsis lipophila TaxID=2117 RepID=UPI00387363E1